MEYKAKANWYTQLLHHPIARIILGSGICFGLMVVGKKAVIEPILNLFIESETLVSTLGSYAGFGMLLGIYYFLFRYWENRKVAELSLKKWFPELVGGLLFGFAVISLEMLVLYLTGNFKVIGWESFTFFGFSFSVLVLMAMLEEVVFRGIFYRILVEWKGTWTALLVTSIVFSLLHLANPHQGVMSVVMGVIFGMVHSMLYTVTNRLWLPFSFHLGWNMAQPFWGTNLTGIDEFGVVLKTQSEGPAWLIGGGTGIEDSVLSLVVLSVIFLVLLRIAYRKGLMGKVGKGRAAD